VSALLVVPVSLNVGQCPRRGLSLLHHYWRLYLGRQVLSIIFVDSDASTGNAVEGRISGRGTHQRTEVEGRISGHQWQGEIF
jgi:hypothetical protein